MIILGRTRTVSALRLRAFRSLSSERQPPRQLLQRQAKRNGEVDETASSQLIVTSLKDIVSMFQPSANTQDDDELESIIHREDIIRRLELGELKQLLLQKFSATSISGPKSSAEECIENLRIPSRQITESFLSLTESERDLIETSLELIPIEQDWNKIPLVQKQLLYYIGYGSYGPRLGISFEAKIPEDFGWKVPSSPKHPGDVVHKLSDAQKTNILTCIPSRSQHFERSFKKLDGGSRLIIWAAILVALIASYRDYKNRNGGEDSTITTAKLVEVPLDMSEEPLAGDPVQESILSSSDSNVQLNTKKWYQFWK